jgi:hypothetical protein
MKLSPCWCCRFCTLHQSFYHKSMFKLLEVIVTKVV